MLLDLAGIERLERVMEQSSIGNARDFERIAEALILQHPRIHVRESRKKSPYQGGKPTKGGHKGKSKGANIFEKAAYGGQGKGFRKAVFPSAYPFYAEVTAGYDDTYGAEGYDDGQYWDDGYTEPVAFPANRSDDSECDGHDDGHDYDQDEEEYTAFEVDDPILAAELDAVALLCETCDIAWHSFLLPRFSISLSFSLSLSP